MATAKNVKRKQGDTYPVEVCVQNEDGSAYDLTGVSEIKIGVFTKATVPDAATDLIFLATGAVTEAAAGKAEFPVAEAEADAFEIKKYFAEVQFIQSTYKVTTNTFEFEIEGQIIW